MARRVTNPTSIPKVVVWSLASLSGFSGLRIQHCHEQWCRLAAAALIRPLAWGLSYAATAALKNKQKQNQTKSR